MGPRKPEVALGAILAEQSVLLTLEFECSELWHLEDGSSRHQDLEAWPSELLKTKAGSSRQPAEEAGPSELLEQSAGPSGLLVSAAGPSGLLELVAGSPELQRAVLKFQVGEDEPLGPQV